MSDKVTGYKGFNKHLQCTPDRKVFQYEVGNDYEETEAVLCECGFHFCKNPLSVWDFYDIFESRFCVVEADADNVIDLENKSVTTKIAIKYELSFLDYIKTCVDYLIGVCKPSGDYSQLASSGHSSQLAASGDYSQLASSGNYSQLASSCYSGKLASSGHSSKLAASGDYSQLASSGDSSKLASSGHSSQLASSGHSSQLAASGDYSKLAASGDSSQLASSGKDSVVAAIGAESSIKASLGSWIVLAEYDDDGKPVTVKAAKIDGKKLKADIAYTLRDGKFVEVFHDY